MDQLLVVLFTVLITIFLVLLVQALFRYVLVRPSQQCRRGHAERCSSQVITTSMTTGQVTANATTSPLPDEPRVGIVCETVSSSHRLTDGNGSGAPADGANKATSTGFNVALPDNGCSVTKRTTKSHPNVNVSFHLNCVTL